MRGVAGMLEAHASQQSIARQQGLFESAGL